MVSIDLEQATRTSQLRAAPLARAATTVAVAAYLICAALAILAPEALMWVFQSWFHGLGVARLRPAGASLQAPQLVVGLITFGGAVWLTTAAIAALYNGWTRR